MMIRQLASVKAAASIVYLDWNLSTSSIFHELFMPHHLPLPLSPPLLIIVTSAQVMTMATSFEMKIALHFHDLHQHRYLHQ
jgi:hypothetical protein